MSGLKRQQVNHRPMNTRFGAGKLRSLIWSRPVTNFSRAAIVVGCVTVYTTIVLAISASVPLIEPDSESYLQFSIQRTLVYPIFLHCLTWIGLALSQIAIVQVALSSLALTILIPALIRAGLPACLIVVFTLALAGNTAFAALNRTILSEGIYLPVTMVAIAVWLDYLRSGRIGFLAALSFCLGLSIAIRPAGMFLLPMLAIAVWLKWHDRNCSAVLTVAAAVLPLAVAVAAERIPSRIIHGQHTASVLPYILFGKAAMLAHPRAEFVGPHAPALRALNEKLSDIYAPAHVFLAQMPSAVAWPVMSANFEVVAQFSLLNAELKELSVRHDASEDRLRIELAQQLIASALPGYFRLTLIDYISHWSIGALKFPPAASALADYIGDRPVLPLEDGANITVLRPAPSRLAYLVYPAFMVAGAVTLALSLLLVAFLVRPSLGTRHPNLMLASFMAASAHCTVILTSLINIGTPRFLMAVYPQILLAILFAIVALSNMSADRNNWQKGVRTTVQL
jgi:hypothetical protein